MAYDFEIVYKRGKDNRAVDALLRLPGEKLFCMALSSISLVLYQQILYFYDQDKALQKMLVELQQDPRSYKNLSWHQRQLRWKGRTVVGKDADLQQQILQVFHSSSLGGHSGVHVTY